MVDEIPLSEFGLTTVEDAAVSKGWGVRAVQNWINAGLLRAVRAGSGQRCVFLLRVKDVGAFTPPPRGRPKAESEPKKARGKKPPKGR